MSKVLPKTIFREKDIIYNDVLDDIARKINIAHIIAYETTSHWYDNVFLSSKEGFIIFLAAHVLDQVLYIYIILYYTY